MNPSPQLDSPSQDGASEPIAPLAQLLDLSTGDWLELPPADPVTAYIHQNIQQQSGQPASWEAARFSRAVYLYREKISNFTLVVKYYTEKTGPKADYYARHELGFINQATAAGLLDGKLRALQPFGTWRGILFLEHVSGLNLADVIATRQSQPGRLLSSLVLVTELLARLHANSLQSESLPDFQPAVKDSLKYIDNLAASSLLKSEPVIADGLRLLVERWSQRPEMVNFTPCLIHGDATTTNFVFPDDTSVVAIDWERLKTADPAADIGRLAAEVSHSLRQQGGSGTEVASQVEHLISSYDKAAAVDIESLRPRLNFYQATSTLRIARNGWLPRLERMTLVAQAMAMLE